MPHLIKKLFWGSLIMLYSVQLIGSDSLFIFKQKALYNISKAEQLAPANHDSALYFITLAEQYINEINDDTLKAKLLKTRGYYYQEIDSLSLAMEYYNTAIEMYTKLNDTDGRISVLSHLVRFYYFIGEIDKAQTNVDILINSFSSDTLLLANNIIWKGLISKSKGEPDNAIAHYRKAIELYNQLQQTCYTYKNDSLMFNKIELLKSKALNNIAGVNMGIKDYKNAEAYYLKSHEIKVKLNDKIEEANSWMALSSCYRVQKKYSKSREMLKKCLEILKPTNNSRKLGQTYYYYGKLEKDLGKFKDANQYFKLAIFYFKKCNSKVYIARVYFQQGLIYQLQNNHKNALTFLLKAKELFTEIALNEELLFCLEKTIEILEESKNYQQAFNLQKEYYEIKGQFDLTKQQKKVLIQESKYQLSKKQQELEIIELQNIQKEATIKQEKAKKALFALIATLTIIIGASSILIILFKQKAHKEKLAQQRSAIENKLLRSQLNPHFIFNSLNSAQAFILENDKKDAVLFLSKFSKLMRLVLKSSREETISFSEEHELLILYLGLEQKRFGSAFLFNIEIDEDIDTESINIPPLLTQPFIENAIIHGLSAYKQGGLLNINYKLSKSPNIIECTITDNGIGREQSGKKTIDQMKKSEGVNLITERLALFENEFNKKLNFAIDDLYENNKAIGTKVIIEFPFFSQS